MYYCNYSVHHRKKYGVNIATHTEIALVGSDLVNSHACGNYIANLAALVLAGKFVRGSVTMRKSFIHYR